MSFIRLTSRLINLMLVTGMLVAVTPRMAVAGAIELTIVRGKVWVQRKGASTFSPVSGKTRLQIGDWVKTEPGATAAITCPDSTRQAVSTYGTARGIANYCRGNSLNALRSGSLPPLPGGNVAQIPYIITPRYTLLLNDKPTLRWNPIEGATSYTVRLYGRPKVNGVVGRKVQLWQTQVSGTQVVYAGEQPLQPRVDYWLVVVANNGQSSEQEKCPSEVYNPQARDGVSGCKFQLIGADEALALRVAVEESQQLDATEEEKAIAVANEYAAYNLYAEAIATLEALVAKDSTTPVVYRTLGDFYGTTGLNLLAQQHYLKAIELASTQRNSWEKVTAQDHLGALYVVMNQKNDALRLWQEARAGYQSLGATELVKLLQERIGKIQ